MEIVGPAQFFDITFPEGRKIIPSDELGRLPTESYSQAIAYAIGMEPTDVSLVYGYVAYFKQENTWIFGKSLESLATIAEGWSREQVLHA